MANRYWVGGTGSWTDYTRHWSATSGGSPGASVPTMYDNVYFDANSFSTAGQTVTVNTNAVCLNMDWTGVNKSVVFYGGYNPISIHGSLTLVETMSFPRFGILDFCATTAGKTIDTKGVTLGTGDLLRFNGAGGEWTLLSDITCNATTFHVAKGTLITNNYDINCVVFKLSVQDGATREVRLGSSTITVSGHVNNSPATGLTFNAGTSTFVLTGNNTWLIGGDLNYYNVELSGTGITVSADNSFNDLKVAAGKTVKFIATTTQTVGSLTMVGTNGNLITLESTVPYSPFTISKASGSVTVKYCSIKDCTVTGGAEFKAANSISAGGNTGWVFLNIDTYFLSEAMTLEEHREALLSGLLSLSTEAAIIANAVPTLLEVFNSLQRYIIPKVKLYLNGDDQDPTIIEGTDLVDINLLEEASAESEDILGVVSSNELSIGLYNKQGIFTPTNPDGPYYGLLKPDVLVEAYLYIQAQSEEYYEVPLGSFRTGDWLAPSETLVATVTCYDQLYFAGKRPIPNQRVFYNTTYKELFEKLLDLANITNYTVSSALSIPVQVGWLIPGTLMDNLKWLTKASCSFAYIDRQGCLVVETLNLTGTASITLTDEDQLINMSVPTAYYKAASSLTIQRYLVAASTTNTVINLQNQEIAGVVDYSSLSFNDAPIAALTHVGLLGRERTELASVQYNAFDVTIQVSNESTAELVDIEIVAVPLSILPIQRIKKEVGGTLNEKEVVIAHPLIQDADFADSYATNLFNLVKDPEAYVSFKLRGNTIIKVGSIVKCINPSDNFREETVLVLRSNLSYACGLSHTIEGIRIPQEVS